VILELPQRLEGRQIGGRFFFGGYRNCTPQYFGFRDLPSRCQALNLANRIEIEAVRRLNHWYGHDDFMVRPYSN
jgi:hypothetical protein